MQRLVIKALQSYWRISRGLTMGAQGLVLDDAGRVLLVRHGYRPGWHFPGGGVEKGEAAIDALNRELAEEAGITPLEPPEFFGLYTNFEAFPSDHVALFVVRRWRQPRVPPPNREIAEQRFVAPSDLPEGTVGPVRRRLEELAGRAPRTLTW
jgi:8-oxo-dGTP pyrophosphatase MutT (NUDIX family)